MKKIAILGTARMALVAVVALVVLAGCQSEEEKYVRKAVKLMDKSGLFAEGEAWEEARAAALAERPATREETYEVVRQALKVAGGKHSFIMTVEQQQHSAVEDAETAPSVAVLEDGIAVITLPAFSGQNNEENRRYVSAVLDALPETAPGAVIDLRGNTGGNMYPMIAAVHRFLPDDTILRFKSRKYTQPITKEFILQCVNVEAQPRSHRAYRSGEWNKGRIEAYGTSLRTWVNGIQCSDFIDDVDASGFIALQVHAPYNESYVGRRVAWKNIRILTEDIEKYLTPEGDIYQINCIPNTLSEREKQEGWQLLWDGKTTNGWRGAKLDKFPEKGWIIEDNMLKVQKGNGGESTNGGDIVTTRTYRNFILKVDFKLTEGANSGIKYFVKPDLNKGEGSAIGCEFQLLDDQRHPDAKLGVKGNRKLGSLYDLIPAPEDKFFDLYTFNTAMVIVRGNHVEHWLNGVKILEYNRNNQMFNALVAYSKYRNWPNFGNHVEGNILLQDHGDEVWFKNVKILELK